MFCAVVTFNSSVVISSGNWLVGISAAAMYATHWEKGEWRGSGGGVKEEGGEEERRMREKSKSALRCTTADAKSHLGC